MNGGGAEKEGDTESEAGSRLRAISPEPDTGLELTDREIVTWAEVGCLTDWATQAPLILIFIFERQRQNVSGLGAEREAEREGDTESEAGSRLWASSQHRAWCGARTHELWDHDLSRSQTLNWLSYPGVRLLVVLNCQITEFNPVFEENKQKAS